MCAGDLVALLADDVDAAHVFSPRRVRVLEGTANQAAIAIENARLQIREAERARLGRELELAHDIQMTLLLGQQVRYVGNIPLWCA